MHSDVGMQLTELPESFSDQFANIVFLKSAVGYFLGQWSLWWQRKYTQKETGKKLY